MMRLNMKIIWRLATFLFVGLSLAACVGLASGTANEKPAAIELVKGSEVMRITLTEAAARGTGITTVPVAGVTDGLLPYDPFNYGNFSNPIQIDNPWFSLQPGKQWIHDGITFEEGTGTPHRIEFTVTDLTKRVDGVPTIVALIVDISDGEIVEEEIAFFAQDDDQTVWLMGEHPEEFEDGEFKGAPTWIAGALGARAGIAMQSNPQEGTPHYAQGWAPAVNWTDRARVWKMGQTTTVGTGTYDDVLIIDEFNLMEPDIKLKYYANGVGLVRVGWRGEPIDSSEDLELVDLNQIDPEALASIREQALALDQHAYEVSPKVYSQTEPAKLLATAMHNGETKVAAEKNMLPPTVVPQSAVVYGLRGETWVYTLTETPLTYEQHPVTVDIMEGGMAVLSDGPPLGTEVVTVGAMELYGVETGLGK